MTSPPQPRSTLTNQFRVHWQASTSDDNLTLHGFRRFKTSHLLNLRFLESEIAELDHRIYQAGIRLNTDLSAKDRIGLRHVIKDGDAPEPDKTIDEAFVLKLRDLVRQYDNALSSFNTVMAMETCSLLDISPTHSFARTNSNLEEIYNTRLVRVDLGPRSNQDPFQRRLHKLLRSFRYWHLSKRLRHQQQSPLPDRENHGQNALFPPTGLSNQNTVLLSAILARASISLLTAMFLVVPLTALSYEPSKSVQLSIISACIILFAGVVSGLLRVSSVEMMMVTAGYGAVLSVFVSNT
ncbi:MAG: hypothetical protein Q9227_004321 [Pyrenula ochraceoflavens]